MKEYGYLETLTVNTELHSEILKFMCKNNIFANFDYIDNYVVYYFKKSFDYETIVEFIENIKTKENK